MIWESRELTLLLARRNVHLRYQYTVAGLGWALLQPLLTVIVLSAFRLMMGYRTTDNVPYGLYVGTSLVPWTFFVHALTLSAHSVLKHTSVLFKVHFPRIVLPLSSVAGAAADLVIGLALLPILMIYFRFLPHWTILLLPLFALQVVLFAAGLGIWMAYLNTKYRDLANALPFLTQLWFFLTPIAYTSNVIADKWRPLAGLNPMLGIIEGFRYAITGAANPFMPVWALTSLAITAFLLVTGTYRFLQTEDILTDLI